MSGPVTSEPTAAPAVEQPLAPPPPERVQTSYTLHSQPQLEEAVRQGHVVIGKLRVYKRWGMNLSFCSSPLFPRDVVLNRPGARRDAMNGDIVAVALLPPNQWARDRVDEADSNDGGDADRLQDMPGVLPDGRRIVRVVDDEKSTADGRRSQAREVQLHTLMGGAENYDWPAGFQPTGNVVSVLHRDMDCYYVGRIMEGARSSREEPLKSNYYYRFRLYNPLMPLATVAGRDIPFPYHEKLEDCLFLLRITKGPDGNVVLPMGGDMLGATVHMALGLADSVEANTWAIRNMFDIKSDVFSQELEDLIPDSVDIPATSEGVAAMGRRDLRQEEFVCTIDPATARDLDDALSIRRTAGGGYHVGVHIADVSYFVQPNTPLDEEAQSRCNSTYFVDRVVPMLPRKLSEIHCSLNPSEDKLAFSCLFDLDKDGKVVSEWFGRSVIRSRCRLAYEEAQQIIDGEDIELDLAREEEHSGVSVSELKKSVYESVRLLYHVASKRRKESLERGRLTIGSSRLAFQFDHMNSKLAPRGFFVQHQIDANWLVEEFMLLANNRTAEKIVQFIPDGGMLRHHLPPEKKKMVALQESLRKLNVPFKGSSAKALQDTLDTCKGRRDYYGLCEVFKYSQHAAAYFGNNVCTTFSRAHFALGLPWYTHFTSPIRRYPDIMAHRQLLVAIELETLLTERGIELPSRPDPDVVAKPGDEVFDTKAMIKPEELKYRDYYYPASEVDLIASASNEAKEDSRRAGEMSLQLFFCMYLQALLKKAEVDTRISKRQMTFAFVLKITPGSFLLYMPEIATQVEVGFLDTKQLFTVVEEEGKKESDDAGSGSDAAGGGRQGPPVDGQGREINVQAKAARRAKGGKQGMPDRSRAAGGGGDGGQRGAPQATPNAVKLRWNRTAAGSEEDAAVMEEVSLFTEVVGELVVVKKGSMTTLDVVILPPWERQAYYTSGVQIPQTLD